MKVAKDHIWYKSQNSLPLLLIFFEKFGGQLFVGNNINSWALPFCVPTISDKFAHILLIDEFRYQFQSAGCVPSFTQLRSILDLGGIVGSYLAAVVECCVAGVEVYSWVVSAQGWRSFMTRAGSAVNCWRVVQKNFCTLVQVRVLELESKHFPDSRVYFRQIFLSEVNACFKGLIFV